MSNPPPDLAVLARRGCDEDEDEIVSTLIDAVDGYAADHIDAQRFDRAHTIPRELLTELAEMGLFSLSIPEAWGGAGLSLHAVCEVLSALAAHDRSIATTVGLHLGLGTRGLVAFGSSELQERILPSLATGERIAAFAATEPGAGSDLKRISTRVREEGDGLRVDGTKIFVTNGGFADVFTLLTTSPGLGGARRGQSLILLEREDEGLNIGAEEQKLGLRASSTVTVNLDGVCVPRSRIIGEPGLGTRLAGHVLSWGRTAMAAGCVGSSAAALDQTIQHALTRKQFGKPLAQLPVVRAQIAAATAELYAARALVRWTTCSDETELVRRSTSAKVFCSRAAWSCSDRALQLHGGAGFIEETGIALILRDTRVTRIFEGANDVLLGHAGSLTLLDPPNRTPLSEAAPADPLAAKADGITQIAVEMAAEIKHTLGMKALARPPILHQLGEVVVLADAARAAAMRALAEGTEHGRSTASLFLHHVQQRIELHRAPLPQTELIRSICTPLYERGST